MNASFVVFYLKQAMAKKYHGRIESIKKGYKDRSELDE